MNDDEGDALQRVAAMRETLLEVARSLRVDGEKDCGEAFRILFHTASEVLLGVAGGFEEYLRSAR